MLMIKKIAVGKIHAAFVQAHRVTAVPITARIVDQGLVLAHCFAPFKLILFLDLLYAQKRNLSIEKDDTTVTQYRLFFIISQ